MAFSLFAPDLLGRHPWSRPKRRSLTKVPCKKSTVSEIASVCLVDSLTEALERGYVRPFGNQIPLDPNGFLPENTSPAVTHKYEDNFGDVVANLSAVLVHRKLYAIFVRGSAATGNLLGNFMSDLDLVVFTEKKVSVDEKGRLRERLLPNLRKSIHVGNLDIRYLHKEKGRGGRQQFRFSPTLRIMLRYFAIPIYGSLEEVGISDVPLQPKPHLAMDIRNDIISFQRAMQTGPVNDSFSFQLSAIQWLCKKCLRAIAELASLKSGGYARDLLPCYQLGLEAYPEFAVTMLHGLLIACASPENRYLDMRKDDIRQQGACVALQFAEVVEELSIRQCFGAGPVTRKEPLTIVSNDGLLHTWGLSDPYEKLRERLFACLFIFNRRISVDNIEFRTRPLPVLEVKGNKFVDVQLIDLEKEQFGTAANFDKAFTNVSEPVVYRDRLHEQGDGAEITCNVLRRLLRSTRTVQCRVSRGHNVAFCRSSHQWMEEQMFTPPSVLISLPVADAVQRLGEHQGLSNLFYDDCDNECVYIQTRALPSLRVFESSKLQAWRLVQEERLWISCHGTVSTLHYDASYSALYQRCGQKRLLFFPPSCLPELGIYPLGHPLHRRGRVDLTRKDTLIFREFWKSCASKAIEVTVHAGDLLLFPPFWSHYTETMTSSTQELSISHTLRYVST